MEKLTLEPIKNELSPEALGQKFNAEDFSVFTKDLRQKVKENPNIRFSITADWTTVQKARSAKALFDQYSLKLNIDSFTIRATRQQKDEDVNVFESGVSWEEIF